MSSTDASFLPQAESNFQTLINTLNHQLDVYRKAAYKKKQGMDEDEEEDDAAAKRKAQEEEEKKRKAEKLKRENEERIAARKAAEEARKKQEQEEGKEGTVAKKEKKDDDEDASDDEGKGAKPIGNGGITEKYSWTQTLGELQVRASRTANLRYRCRRFLACQACSSTPPRTVARTVLHLSHLPVCNTG